MCHVSTNLTSKLGHQSFILVWSVTSIHSGRCVSFRLSNIDPHASVVLHKESAEIIEVLIGKQ